MPIIRATTVREWPNLWPALRRTGGNKPCRARLVGPLPNGRGSDDSRMPG